MRGCVSVVAMLVMAGACYAGINGGREYSAAGVIVFFVAAAVLQKMRGKSK